MADAKKCDRCGVLFEPYCIEDRKFRYVKVESKIICTKNNRRENIAEFDLCYDCAKSFDKWMKLGGDNNEQ